MEVQVQGEEGSGPEDSMDVLKDADDEARASDAMEAEAEDDEDEDAMRNSPDAAGMDTEE